MDGDGAGAQPGDELAVARGPGLDAACVFLRQTLGAEAPHAQAQQRIGQQAALGQAEQAGRGAVGGQRSIVQCGDRHGMPRQDFGNQGKKAGVRRW
ncbi:hypothetical protein D3C72_2117370 [compost metagenome]